MEDKSVAAGNEGRSNFSHDFMASIVVFLVALPLCMGIALASGAPPAAGLITGIVGGLIVGCFSGSPLQVSGPAAGLSVVVYDLVQTHGLEVLGIIVLLAGLIQLAAGLLKLGQWFRAVSPAVIQGMLAGIGVLILVSQFHLMVDGEPRKGGIANIQALPEAVYDGLFAVDGSTHHWAARVGALTILVIVLWKLFAPKRIKFIPAPLVAVCVATALTAVLGLEIRFVQIADDTLTSFSLPGLETFQQAMNPTIVVAAIALALIASAETLLCASAVDKMNSNPETRTKYDRELAAQGFGNALCGIVGGLPMTGVIVRSATNIEAGARTRASSIMHGAWLLVLVAFFPALLRLIPTATLAAVLVYTGYKLVNPTAIRELWKYGKSEVFIYMETLTVIVVEDLLLGVLVGIALSAIKLLYVFSHLEIHRDEDPARNRTQLRLKGSATFIRLPKLAACLEQIQPSTELHVDLEQLDYIDHACLDLLMNWEKSHQATGGMLVIDWGSLTRKYQPGVQTLEAAA